MKLPAVAIATALAGGILLGLGPWLSQHTCLPGFPISAGRCSVATKFLLLAA
jgi:hypothetical protein